MDVELHHNRGHMSILLTVLTLAPSKVLGTGYMPNKVFSYSIYNTNLLITYLEVSANETKVLLLRKKQ